MINMKNKAIAYTLLSTIVMGSISMPASAAINTEHIDEYNYTSEYIPNFSELDFDINYNQDGKIRVSKNGYRLIVIDGKLVEWPAELPDPTPEQIKAIKQEKGKFTLAIKAIRKGYSKLPPKIKGYIAKYLGLNAILGTLDHWTGAIEDGLYWGCKKVGMPDWMAWTVAKALTMIAL